jgi:hypothetical protein
MAGIKRITFLQDGTDLCAVGTPSATVTIDEIELQFPELVGLPYAVCCGYFYQTTATFDAGFAKIVSFNLRDDIRTCEYFSTVPANCTRKTGCAHFSVS